jgi:hypothetical protein
MESQSVQIAKTIINQIKALDFWFLGAVGAQKFIALPESKEFQGGVQFKVNGMRHKGYVKIELRWVDDYTITFMKRNGDVVKQCEGVYCDMLIDILDWIEGK